MNLNQLNKAKQEFESIEFEKKERTAKMVCFVGTNGTGKTTLLEQILLKLVETGERAVIVTPDIVEWTKYPINELSRSKDYSFKGIQRHIFDPETTLEKISLLKKCIVVFDDCRSYLMANTDIRIRQLLIRRRQREVDIFAVGHGFTEIPPVFFTFSTEIILFRTTDNIDRRKNYLKDFDFAKKVQFEVNKKALKEPHYKQIIKW